MKCADFLQELTNYLDGVIDEKSVPLSWKRQFLLQRSATAWMDLVGRALAGARCSAAGSVPRRSTRHRSRGPAEKISRLHETEFPDEQSYHCGDSESASGTRVDVWRDRQGGGVSARGSAGGADSAVGRGIAVASDSWGRRRDQAARHSGLDQRLRLEMEGVTFRGRRVNMRLHEFKFGPGGKKKTLTAKGGKKGRKGR